MAGCLLLSTLGAITPSFLACSYPTEGLTPAGDPPANDPLADPRHPFNSPGHWESLQGARAKRLLCSRDMPAAAETGWMVHIKERDCMPHGATGLLQLRCLQKAVGSVLANYAGIQAHHAHPTNAHDNQPRTLTLPGCYDIPGPASPVYSEHGALSCCCCMCCQAQPLRGKTVISAIQPQMFPLSLLHRGAGWTFRHFPCTRGHVGYHSGHASGRSQH